MKKFLKILFYIFAAIYPVIVFTFLVILKLPVRILSLCIIVLASAFFLSATGNKKQQKKSLDWKPLVSSTLLLMAGVFCFFTQQIFFLKLYSVTMSLVFLIVFASTLFFKPNIIFRFATLSDKSILGSSFENEICKYCKKVTIIWCCFFILNGTTSVITAFSKNIFNISEDLSNTIWSVYNGGISYFLMGLLFGIEFIIRMQVDKKIVKPFPISNFKSYSRKQNHVVCYFEHNKKESTKRWKDFLVDICKMRKFFCQQKETKWVLKITDNWYFLVAFVALIQCKKNPVIALNAEKIFDANEIGILSDNVNSEKNIIKIISTQSEPSVKEHSTLPDIDSKTLVYFVDEENWFESPLEEIENKINQKILSQGKQLISQTKPNKIDNNNSETYLENLLLNFTLGLIFYR